MFLSEEQRFGRSFSVTPFGGEILEYSDDGQQQPCVLNLKF